MRGHLGGGHAQWGRRREEARTVCGRSWVELLLGSARDGEWEMKGGGGGGSECVWGERGGWKLEVG
jgi:hypothetical protein